MSYYILEISIKDFDCLFNSDGRRKTLYFFKYFECLLTSLDDVYRLPFHSLVNIRKDEVQACF